MRKYFTFTAFVSFVVCMALVVMWVRSDWTRTAYEFWRADGLWEVVSDKGRIWVDNQPQKRIEEYHHRGMAKLYIAQLNRMLDRLHSNNAQQHQSKRERQEEWELGEKSEEAITNGMARAVIPLSVPIRQRSLTYRFPVIASAVLPYAWIVSFLVRRRLSMRINSGLCVGCGYDLRTSKDRCPECGNIPAAKSKGAA